MDGAINLLDEEEASIEADRSSQNEETQSHDGGVSKIEEDRSEFRDLKLGEKIEHRV